MKALTIRNLPPDVEKLLKRRAAEKRLRLNKAVTSLLEEVAGRKKVLHHDLDHLAGSWTKKEASDFNKTLSKQRIIDKELWN